jgi:eukaryotic-like serine/threonine-protein kinase
VVSVDGAPSDWTISHYRVLHRLGAGGMGEVYAGFDDTLKRRVALKAVRREHRLSASSQARFRREARILSQLDHAHICRVYDYIEHDDCDWLVLELIEGRSLQTALKSGLDVQTSLKVAAQIAGVLVVTHAAGVVHRDLKPANVMLTTAGDVKVLDFGLARSTLLARGNAGGREPLTAGATQIGDGDDEVTQTFAIDTAARGIEPFSEFQTQPGGRSGTLAYMSPEQARGEAGSSASDMYSFGLVLQEMFTRQRAYPPDLDGAALLERVRRADTNPVSGLSGDLTTLIRRLTALPESQRLTAIEASERLQWIREKPKRRLRQVGAAAVVAVAILGGLKYTFDLQRERTAAVRAREDADRRRGQAETLIGFMLGDLRTKLEQVGRLDVLEEVYSRATTYFASVPPDTLSTEEISRRAQSLHQIGLVRQRQGNMPAAVEAYGESLKLATHVASTDPSNAEWRLRLGTAHFYLGDALRRQGDLDGAMREFSAYRDIAQGLVHRDPENSTWLLERSYGHSNVAAVYEAQGDLDAARRELELGQAVKEDLARRDPGNVEWQQAVANGHNRLGVVLEKLGAGDAPLEHFRADLEIRRRLADSAPRDFTRKRALYVALSYVARAYEEKGELGPAFQYAQASHEVATNLAAADPKNIDWQRDQAIAERRLGDVLRWRGALDQARPRYVRALGVLQPIAKAAPTNLPRQRELASLEIALGTVELTRNDVPSALSHALAAEQVILPVLERSKDAESSRIAAEARLLLAAVAVQRGDLAGARQLREAALGLLSTLPAAARDRQFRAIEARAFLALDRVSDARPLVEQLMAGGYRHPSLLSVWRAKDGNGKDLP